MKPGPRVLVVNDNPDEIDALDARLRALGYRTSLLQDGEQALDVVSRDPPDLVVLDAFLPSLNGFQACREIKRIAPRLPVVMLSPRTEPADRFWAQECGAAALLARPLDLAVVVQRIAALLGGP